MELLRLMLIRYPLILLSTSNYAFCAHDSTYSISDTSSGIVQVSIISLTQTTLFALSHNPYFNGKTTRDGIGQTSIDEVKRAEGLQIYLNDNLSRRHILSFTALLNHPAVWKSNPTQWVCGFDKPGRAINQSRALYWPAKNTKEGYPDYWSNGIQLQSDTLLDLGLAVTVTQAEQKAWTMSAHQRHRLRFEAQQKTFLAMTELSVVRQRVSAAKRQRNNALHIREVYKNQSTLSKKPINDLLHVDPGAWKAMNV